MDTAQLLMVRLADTTSIRDREQIESSLGRLLVDFLHADEVSLIKVASEQGRLVGTYCLTVRRHADGELDLIHAEAKVDLDGKPDWRACHATGLPRYATTAAGSETTFAVGALNGQVDGLLVATGGRSPESRDLNLVQGILRIVQNHMDLLEYGERDTLTGLLNRKTFESQFERLRGLLAQRESGSTRGEWIAVVDIDRFKAINDGYGHVFGDEVLLLVSNIMQRKFRGSDRVYRFGGEEFVILLRDIDREHAGIVMERLRCAVEDHRFPQIGTVTISIGWTKILSRDTVVTAIGRADEALYHAKQNGRNQSHCHEQLLAAGALSRQRSSTEIELF